MQLRGTWRLFGLGAFIAVGCGHSARSDVGANAGAPAVAGAPACSAACGGSSAGTQSSSGGSAGSHAGVAGATPSAGGAGEEAGAAGASDQLLGGAGGAPERCEPVDPNPQCVADRQMTLTPLVLVDESGDGHLTPGESFVVKSQLTNPGPESHNYYPGVVFSVDTAGVTPTEGDWHDLFALFAEQSQSFELAFELSSAVEPGTLISIEVTPSGINPQAPCCGQHSRTIQISVE